MSNDKPPLDAPSFTSLSSIMEHFSRVPFDQFQQDLNNWFYKSLVDKGVDLSNINGMDTTDFPEQLKKLVTEIYDHAEVLQRKRDNQ